MACLGRQARAQATPVPPPPTSESHVVDLANLFLVHDRRQLNTLLHDYQRRTGHQLFILTLPKLEGDESIEEYSIRVMESWRIGRYGHDDGVLLTISQTPKKVRIEVGYGLEGSIPDAIANRIIREILRPNLAAGRFYEGCQRAMLQLMDEIERNPPDDGTQASATPSPKNRRPAARSGPGGLGDWLANSSLRVLLLLLTPFFLIGLFSRYFPMLDERQNRHAAPDSKRPTGRRKKSNKLRGRSLWDGLFWGGLGGSGFGGHDSGNPTSRDQDDRGGNSGGGGASGDW